MHDCLLPFDDLPWESPAPGLRTKEIARGGKRFRLIELGAGFVEPDWCRKGHAGVVLQGAFELDVDGTAVTFRAGDGISVPAGERTRHRHRATLETATLFVVEEE
jgi:quercetin dioxygenase-like cupin family protein